MGAAAEAARPAAGWQVRLEGPRAEGDRLEIHLQRQNEQTTADLEIHSRFGIGRAVVSPPGGQWPDVCWLKLHLNGLERLRLAGNQQLLELSVAVRGGRPEVRAATREDAEANREQPIGRGHPLWPILAVVEQAEGRPLQIPLKRGYIRLRIPPRLLGQAQELQIEWIDFFRQ